MPRKRKIPFPPATLPSHPMKTRSMRIMAAVEEQQPLAMVATFGHKKILSERPEIGGDVNSGGVLIDDEMLEIFQFGTFHIVGNTFCLVNRHWSFLAQWHIQNWKRRISEIVISYASILPAANSIGYIHLKNGHQYTPEMDIFLRYGTAHCRGFVIWGETSDGFVGYPANFFDDLIKYYYETKIPGEAVNHVGIDLTNPAPWPAALVKSRARKMKLKKWMVDNDRKCVEYILRNKHNPGVAFTLLIFFEGGAKRYQQMTTFVMLR